MIKYVCDYCGIEQDSMSKTIEYKHMCSNCIDRYEKLKVKAQAAYDKIIAGMSLKSE